MLYKPMTLVGTIKALLETDEFRFKAENIDETDEDIVLDVLAACVMEQEDMPKYIGKRAFVRGNFYGSVVWKDDKPHHRFCFLVNNIQEVK